MLNRLQIRQLALTGAVIATLCLFPLLNALASSPVWLHWTWWDSQETLCAWFVLSLAVALTLAIPAAEGLCLLQDLICSVWLLIGVVFVAGALVKFDSLVGYLAVYRRSGGWIVAGIVAILGTLACALLAFPGSGKNTRIQKIPLFLWPLVLLFFFHLARAPGLAASQSATLSPAPTPLRLAELLPPAGVGVGPTSPRTVVLLFDELSPDYLYGARQIDLSRLPALKLMREHSEIHSAAHLHGGATQVAIPALFAAGAAAPRGLVPTLAAAGRSVRVLGWYHDYCRGMALAAASCHANSIYNARTLHDGFSIVDPLWTDLNLLPAAIPFSLLKSPSSVALQRYTLQATRDWMAEQLRDPSADVIYAHVSVPHLPLVTKEIAKLRIPDPFKMSEEGYLTQFDAIEVVVAQVLASHIRPTQLIMLSDHNARPLFPRAQHEHVVFMRLRTWSPGSSEVTAPADAAELVAHMALRPDLD